jgi:hypothetical protein
MDKCCHNSDYSDIGYTQSSRYNVDLIEVWLSDRLFYVSVDGKNSVLYKLVLGTGQGSILGPVLYAIFVAPLFDFEMLLAFADDIFIPRTR